jgi:ABC-type transport system involved in cytochrome bd biosynthesis fused ATPase/permease subunit
VQEAIEKAAGERGRTIIAVAHRLATIQNADIIFVIGSGKVLEQGNHESLLKSRGVYYQMVSQNHQLSYGHDANTLNSVKHRLWIDEVSRLWLYCNSAF